MSRMPRALRGGREMIFAGLVINIPKILTLCKTYKIDLFVAMSVFRLNS